MKKDERYLMFEVQSGNIEALEELIKQNNGLIWSIVRRFLGRGYEADDLYQIGCIGFIKSVKRFDMNFDYKMSTHQMIRDIAAFPEELIVRFNDGKPGSSTDFGLESLFGNSAIDMMMKLDDQAFNTLKTTLLVEYARCSDLSAEGIVKAFAGINLVRPQFNISDKNAKKSVKKIRAKNKIDE